MERTLKTQTGNAVIVVGTDGTARLRAASDRVAKIKALERKVGRGVAMPMRKVRPSKRGEGRVLAGPVDE